MPVPGGYRNAADFAARAETVRLFPVAPGTGHTPIRSPALRLTGVAVAAAGAADCSIWSWLVA